MSDNQASPARVAGMTFRTFPYEGKRYLLSQPLRYGSYKEEMALVIYLRRDPLTFAAQMAGRLPAHMHASMWEGAFAANRPGVPTEEEWSAYNNSSWKTAYMLWVCLDPKHKVDPETKQPFDLIGGIEEWALPFITRLPRERLQELLVMIAEVSQENAIKNSSGPTVVQAEGPDPQTDAQSTEASQQS